MNLPTTPYHRMCEHHRIHQFKKGQNKGDAPLDKVQRYNHKRVVLTPTHAEVVLYRSVLFRAYPDGTVVLNTDNWSTYTTKDTINTALALFCRSSSPYFAHVNSCTRYGVTQWQYSCAGAGTYAFYDGMTLNPNGIPRDPKPFKRRHLDPTLSRPFAALSKPFKQTFPILYAALPDTIDPHPNHSHPNHYLSNHLHISTNLATAITDKPELWPAILDKFAYKEMYIQGWRRAKLPEPDVVLRAILTAAKQHMYLISDHTVTRV